MFEYDPKQKLWSKCPVECPEGTKVPAMEKAAHFVWRGRLCFLGWTGGPEGKYYDWGSVYMIDLENYKYHGKCILKGNFSYF